MAIPIRLPELTETYPSPLGTIYPYLIRPTMLGKVRTVECVTIWLFNSDELERIKETKVIFARMIGCQPPICFNDANPLQFEEMGKPYVHPDCFDLPTKTDYIKFKGTRIERITSAWELTEQGLRTLFNSRTYQFGIIGGFCEHELTGLLPTYTY